MLLTGFDLVEIDRIRAAMQRPRFCRRVLGGEEYRQLSLRGFPAQSVAASFCAKEAFGKAMGTGVSGFALADVQLLRRENGSPYLVFGGEALRMAQEANAEFSVSVTHTRRYAAAVVIGEIRQTSEKRECDETDSDGTADAGAGKQRSGSGDLSF